MTHSQKQPTELDPEQVAQLASTGDFQFYPTRTAGLARASLTERVIGLIALFVIGTVVVIQFDYAPFLPISLSPGVEKVVAGIGFIAAVIGGLGLLILLGAVVLGFAMAAKDARFPKSASIRCPRCSKTSAVTDWEAAGHCPKCGSDVVYCAKCGKPTSFAGFLGGTGCSHCQHPYVMIAK